MSKGLRLVGAAFPRTGTMSVKAAIEKLGIGTCYHMHEVFNHPEHVPTWRAAFPTGVGIDWHGILDGYVATLDGPACLFWRQIARSYPEAKVLLIVRDPSDWYRSFMSTIYEVVAVNKSDPALQLVQEQIIDGFFEGRIEDQVFAERKFQRYVDDVRGSVEDHRLIEYRITDGWAPLCRALDSPIPDEPFPTKNTRASFAKRNYLQS